MDETFLEETFQLRDEYIPLCDLLKYCSITESGGEAKHLIAEGDVLVDGEVELRKTRKIRAGQVVSGMDFEIRVVAAAP
ncbi:RNA-binding S4 domain-containing protein [Sphaerisporangium sp. NPDC051017]|uniref:RNA-binding S4 domain-containing protein n=1 Tax=Sphaerisporangium sp. NPDC051017 TaxID=3154636 RepID=UPI0034261928